MGNNGSNGDSKKEIVVVYRRTTAGTRQRDKLMFLLEDTEWGLPLSTGIGTRVEIGAFRTDDAGISLGGEVIPYRMALNLLNGEGDGFKVRVKAYENPQNGNGPRTTNFGITYKYLT
jgi:hypothetical protein